jgi:hypothetical protein
MLKIVNSVNKKKILKIVYPWPQYEEESDITHTHTPQLLVIHSTMNWLVKNVKLTTTKKNYINQFFSSILQLIINLTPMND